MKKFIAFLLVIGLSLLAFAGMKKMVKYLNTNMDKKIQRQVDDKVSTIVDSLPTQ